MKTLRRKRPRWGCAALAVVLVPCLSCGLGFFVSGIPAPDPMPREAVMASFEAERDVATSMGFVLDRSDDAEHPSHQPPSTLELTAAPGECVAVVAAVWGSQQPERLRLSRVRGDAVVTVSESTPSGHVAHVQWCAAEAQQLRIELARRGEDFYRREGHRAGGSRVAVYRAPATRIGGVVALKRGRIPDEGLEELRGFALETAERERPSGAPLADPIEIASMSARLVPEDLGTYRELHRGALGRATGPVNPRFTPLPPTVRADWRPGVAAGVARAAESLRAALKPEEHPTETHPAVRDSDDGFVRVLAVIDADRLGPRCADLQLVRMRFGERAVVQRARAGHGSSRALRAVDNLALDRVCRGQGTLVYVTRPTDQEPYLLRLYEAG